MVHEEHMVARRAKFQAPALPLSPPVVRALEARGIRNLFVHQARAIDAARAGAIFLLAIV